MVAAFPIYYNGTLMGCIEAHMLASSQQTQQSRYALILEDDESVAELITWILTDEGFRVHLARFVADARDACVQSVPDLVIADLLLPDGLGTQLIKELRAETRTRDVSTIIMSAVPQATRHAREAGADACLSKPFDLTEFLDTVASLTESERPRVGRSVGELRI